ncbi:MAG TPA: putative glycoside hydrolase, partial [Bacillota bacterium]|nr:putative glycoside hydrolase [Bacillota bacterium]
LDPPKEVAALKKHRFFLAALLIFLIFAVFSTAGCMRVNPVGSPGEDEEEDPADPEEEYQRRLEEWERRNEELREQLGPFYVPLPPLDQPENPPAKIRGIYLTGHTVGHSRYQEILKMIEGTEINAVVIDIKDDHGLMSYQSNIEIIKEIDAHYQPVPITDIKATLEDLHKRGIYTIARIVVFKDPYLARAKPEWAIQKKGGGLWTEKGVAWINPYQKEVWDYNIAIAKEAALMGFREVQFDYIRFPENAAKVDREAYYPGSNGVSKAENIAAFLDYAMEQLKDYNVYVACDVFGVIATTWGDSDNIGQIWEDFATRVDYQKPMIYPSHYGRGYFGYEVPDAHPAGTVTRALTDAIKRNAPIKDPAIIRPWLQSFTATWILGHIPYGAKEVRQQIDAALALGIEEYILWSPVNKYPAGAFLSAEEADRRAAQMRQEREQKGLDWLNRTGRQAAESYLEAVQKKDWREAYALEIQRRRDGNQYRDWLNATRGKVKEYTITAVEKEGSALRLSLKLVMTSGEEERILEEQWTVSMENHVWRVKPSSRFLELLEGKAKAEETEQQD